VTSFAASYSLGRSRLALILVHSVRKTRAVLSLLVEVLIEARALQRAARSRYPFADW
jgi:hypothetical protein